MPRRDTPEKIAARWKNALDNPGTGGLPTMCFYLFEACPTRYRKAELEKLGGVVILSDSLIDEQCVVMTVERYFQLRGVRDKPPRQPMMMRQNGRLFMEVL